MLPPGSKPSPTEASAPVLVFRIGFDADGRPHFPFVSPGVEVWFGVSPRQVAEQGDIVWSRVSPDDRRMVATHVATAVAQRRPIDVTARVATRGGAERWVRVRAEPEPPSPARAPIWSGVAIDVTRERLEAAQKEEQRRLLERVAADVPLPQILHELCTFVERHIEGALSTIVLLDRASRTLRYGAAPTMDPEFMGAIEGILIGPDVGTCGPSIHYGTPVISPDLERDPKWNEHIHVARRFGLRSCYSHPFFDAAGHAVGSLATYFRTPQQPEHEHLELLRTTAHQAGIATQRAIAQQALQAAEAELHEANKLEAIGRLAGGVAHDFNNILTVIQGAASVLVETVAPDTTIREDVELILAATVRAETLTRQLLTFGRRQPWLATRVDVNAIVRRTDSLLRRMVRADIEIRLELADDLPRVTIDEGQLEQVVLNLALNAQDALPGGGRIDIRTAVRTEPLAFDGRPGPVSLVRVSVRDDGVGMNAEILRHAFEPFFTTKARGKGTGLGLASVYGIVRRAGGAVSATSAPGEGSEFIVELPAASPGEEKVAAPSRGGVLRASGRGRQPVVLLVEDDEMVRSLAARVLRARGHEVVEAENGRVAEDILRNRQGRFNLVLSDVVMPERSGLDLLRSVRESWPHLPVLLMSGYADDLSLLRQVLESGQPLLSKPFTPDELLRRVQEAMARDDVAVDPPRSEPRPDA